MTFLTLTATANLTWIFPKPPAWRELPIAGVPANAADTLSLPGAKVNAMSYLHLMERNVRPRMIQVQ